MIRRIFVFFCLLLTVLLLTVFEVGAQQPKKVYRIGYLKNNRIGRNEEAFREGLRKLGYVEGQNIVIEWRPANGKIDRLPELAAELVRLKVDCIVAIGLGPTGTAKRATSTIPIVMGNASGDPVQHGLVASLARPGGNVTGVISVSSALAGKRLEVLKEALPKVSGLTVVSVATSPSAAYHVRETEAAARVFGLEFRSIRVRSADDVEKAFRSADKRSADALIVVAAGGMSRHRKRILDLAIETRLPVMYTGASWVRRGGLMSYSTDNRELRRRAATYVDKILKGAKPADLPVEQPTKFRLVINLKTAKQIGITIPPAVLYRADKVIR
jgi:putative ABC transport system substrate-binding protein